ncbi:MAG: 50S ribosomal protein L11 methyltransferase [Janthinobacterium lividum]
MSYRELIVEIAREQAESLSDALLDAGALSVTVEDADADTPDEEPLFGEPGGEPEEAAWRRSRVIALLDEDEPVDALLEVATRMAGVGNAAARATLHIRDVADQDWVRLTQSQFDPIRIGENIWVVPSWHQAPDPDALILELDPGLAFGTGSHPTTRLCMEWLEQTAIAGELAERSVLDYGCGSGILAILAAKCGAGSVVGVDIDAQAVRAANDNGIRNKVDPAFVVPDDCPAGRFDVVVANILSNPLKLLASMLSARVAPGGQLALSGILARQAEDVIQTYAPWITLSVWRERDGWVCLTGRRPVDQVSG